MKSFRIIAVLVLVLLGIVACKKEPQAVLASSVSLDLTSVDIPVGKSITLSAIVYPETTTDKTISWKSSDESVVRVEDGVLYAQKIGSSVVTATCGTKCATCTVNVVPIKVTGVSLDKTSATLKVGETVTLTATVTPSDATDKTVVWSSSDDNVVSVDNGVVKAKKIGKAIITAKAGDQAATCEVTVEATPVTGITLDKTSATLKVGESVTLKATVFPSNASDKDVFWVSTDENIATVDNGVVTAKKIGYVKILARTENREGYSYKDGDADCMVYVVESYSAGHEGTTEEDW